MTNPGPTRSPLISTLLLTTLALLFVGCGDEDDPVTPKNTAPVATADSYFILRGGTLAPTAGVLDNDTEVDGQVLTAVLVTPPANHSGTFALESGGTFTYVHDGSEIPSDSFTYHASDGTDDSAEVTVTITAPVVSEDGSFGPGTITRDLETGLQWLDLTLSTAYTYDEILLEFDPGDPFENYRLATRDEVKALWLHAGVDTTVTEFVSSNLVPVTDLMVFVGVTGPNAGNLGGGNLCDFTVGHIESGPGGGGWVSVAGLLADPDPTATGQQFVGSVLSDNDNTGHGAWLVAN